MKISEILNRKGTKVETIAPQATLSQANAQMSRLGIGAVVVRDPRGGYLGVLSERDILGHIAAEGAAALDSTVADVCSKLRISCRPDDDVKLVMEAMTQRRIRHVPVLVDDELGGIISMGDIVKLQLDEMKIEVGVLRDYARSH